MSALPRLATIARGASVAYWRRRGVAIGSGATISAFAHLSSDGRLSLGDRCTVGRYATLAPDGGSIVIGDDVSIRAFCVVSGYGGVEIGRDTRVGVGVSILSSSHVFDDPHRPIRTQGLTSKGVHIGNDVMIGTKATVLDGVRIGDGAFIGAGALVRTDVEPLSIVGGIPARVIGRRGG